MSNKRKNRKIRQSLTQAPNSNSTSLSESQLHSEDVSDESEHSKVKIVQFSPIKCPSPKNNRVNLNLTGSERKIKDSSADIHNAIDKWDSLSTTGMNIIQEIANIKLSAVYENVEQEDGTDSELIMPPQLECLCDSLLETFTKMRRQVDKLAKVVVVLKGVVDLERHTQSDVDTTDPLFLTWPTSRFASTAQKIYEMYRQESQVRQQIVENIAHCMDRKTMMFYTATWLHSPYIDTCKDELLHSLLLETGHLKQ